MIKILLILSVFWNSLCFAAAPPVSIKGESGSKLIPKWNLHVPNSQATDLGGIDALIETGNENIASDPGFEANDVSAWTFEAGTTTSLTNDVIHGNYSLQIDAGAANRDWNGPEYTVPPYLCGQNGEATIYIKQDTVGGLSGNPVFGIKDHNGNILSYETVPLTTDDKIIKETISFIFPDCLSSNNKVYVYGQVDSLATAVIDDIWIGPNRNLGTVAQAAIVASAYIAGTTNCSWARTSTTPGSFTADTDCPGPTVEYNDTNFGTVSTTDTDLPKFTVSNLVAGQYKVTIGANFSNNTTIGNFAQLAINDGTTTSGSAMLRQSSSASTPATIIGYFNYTGAGSRTFEVYGSATSGDAVGLRNDQTNQKLSFLIERIPSSAEQVLRLNCSGSSCSGNTFSAKISSTGVVSDETGGDWISGSCTNATTPVCTFTSSVFSTTPNCTVTPDVNGLAGGVTVSSSSMSGFLYNISGSAISGARIYACTRAQSDSYRVSAQMPLVKQSVRTDAQTAVNICAGTAVISASPSITRSTGNCAASIAQNATGNATITFANGTFSATPYSCNCNILTTGDYTCSEDTTTALSATSYRVQTFKTSTGAATNATVRFSCIGDK